MAPTESSASGAEAGIPNGTGAPDCVVDSALADELWRGCDAARWGLTRDEFEQILVDAGTAQNFGLAETPDVNPATPKQQAAFFRGLCVADLALARACARGNERAWEHFIAVHRQPLTRAAIAITGSETLGRDLADQLYAELYGLSVRDGQRRCPLLSYRGRGSLIGWLRTTLAQRHVDHYRRTRREEPIEEFDAPAPEPPPQTAAGELSRLEQAIEQAVSGCEAEERYLLAAYYLDDQTLLEIGRVLGVHEATVSRRLHRATGQIRKQILKNLQRNGMSRRAAQEAMGADARDIEVNLKKLLQNSQSEAFQEQAAS
ncbi:MAG: sigma-70 family RNA polymerase sigma factor [Terracidiphilus sp.]|nr:sigma-70 family RNA polymerase sigma factor [Terracidiphilus sp.]MDR3797908.1 sigma-70 family RNA polymerase sigma factor [Terracidiphilus sp.]